MLSTVASIPQTSVLELLVEDKIIHNKLFQFLLNLATVFALFGDDFRLLIKNPEIDQGFVASFSLAFFLFLIELILQSYAVEGFISWPKVAGFSRYRQILCGDLPRGSFYFWLDLISTASLIFELTWLLSALGEGRSILLSAPTVLDLGDISSTFSAEFGELLQASEKSSKNKSSLSRNRASKASASIIKAARIVRIIRIVRVIRLLRMLQAYLFVEKDESTSGSAKLGGPRRRASSVGLAKIAPIHKEVSTKSHIEIAPESNVGRSLSELTQRRVIVGVLVILIVLPLLQSNVVDDSTVLTTRLVHGFWYRRNICAYSDRHIQNCTWLEDGLSLSNDLVTIKNKQNNRLLLLTHYLMIPANGSYHQHYFEAHRKIF
jgi:hypothetical protein